MPGGEAWAENPEGYEKELMQRMQERQELLKDTQLEVTKVLENLQAWAADAARCHDAQSLGWALSSLDVAGGDAERCVAEGAGDGSLLHICARSSGLAASRGGRGSHGARSTARALVGWGAQPDQPDPSGETPLQLALRRPLGGGAAKEPAKALLEVNADPDQIARPGTDETLLMEAAREGDLATCELLLEHRADPLKRRADGHTAITLASRPGCSRQVLMTLRSALTRDLAQESGEETPAIASHPRAGLAPAEAPAASRRTAPGPFSKMAKATAVSSDGKAPPARRRTSFGAFSKLAKPSLDEKAPERQPAEELPTPSSDKVQSMSLAESESETRPGDDTDEGPSRTTLFSMSDIDQEMCSAEGILNQVDIEEAYDDDWTVRPLPAEWHPPRGQENAEAHHGYTSNSWGEGLPESSALQVAG